MSDDANAPDLTPQMPGQVPGVDPDSLSPLLELDLVDLIGGMDALTDLELGELRTLEEQGEARASVLDAIDAERVRRDIDAPKDEPPAINVEPIGDDKAYARMHSHEIDQATLTRPVLTLDGWLLPRPAANPEA